MNSRSPSGFDRLMGILKLVALLAALDFFFVSIGLLGAFKELGAGYGATLIQDLANNPFIGLMLGVLVTSVIQSSSTTTSIVVGLAAGGVFGSDPAEALRLSVPIIMGANMGTSVTAALVSLGNIGNPKEFQRSFSCATVHDFFNLLTVIIILPLQVMTDFLGKAALIMAEAFETIGGLKFSSPFKLITKPQIQSISEFFDSNPMAVQVVVLSVGFLGAMMVLRLMVRSSEANRRPWLVYVMAVVFATITTVGDHYSDSLFRPETATFLFGLICLFTSLFCIVRIMRSVVLDRIQSLFSSVLFKTPARAFAVGIVITALVQSSSITTSLMIPLTGAGLLTIYQIFPYTLGANVGTTITAIMAALAAGELVGIAVAFAHLLFNILGISILYPLRKLPIAMAMAMGKLSIRSKAYPLIFVGGTYLVVPTVFILILG